MRVEASFPTMPENAKGRYCRRPIAQILKHIGLLGQYALTWPDPLDSSGSETICSRKREGQKSQQGSR
jgi:hypothetical protein